MHNDDALDCVAKLADVAGIIIIFEEREHVRREIFRDVAAVFEVVFLNKMLRQRQNVFAPLSERGKLDGHNGQAVIKIFAKSAVLDRFF